MKPTVLLLFTVVAFARGTIPKWCEQAKASVVNKYRSCQDELKMQRKEFADDVIAPKNYGDGCINSIRGVFQDLDECKKSFCREPMKVKITVHIATCYEGTSPMPFTAQLAKLKDMKLEWITQEVYAENALNLTTYLEFETLIPNPEEFTHVVFKQKAKNSDSNHLFVYAVDVEIKGARTHFTIGGEVDSRCCQAPYNNQWIAAVYRKDAECDAYLKETVFAFYGPHGVEGLLNVEDLSKLKQGIYEKTALHRLCDGC
ncbi:hypothetical protein QR680_018698 [Steinernema hermaphroditum]|uniref:Uncharacterized protein n=1 Tax=Steinernema hermaphroditum TaxID=289476 RepID=A0AA39HIR2_9BILA|nr:hypothetical protein QR680_018698 [Steinernema hermaphroditum]